MKKLMARSWKALLVTGVLSALAVPAAAGMISTDQALAQSDRDRVRAFLERKDAEEQMKALGVAPGAAQQRVAAMTDEEVRVVAARIDSLPAGAALSKDDWIIVLLLFLLVVILV